MFPPVLSYELANHQQHHIDFSSPRRRSSSSSGTASTDSAKNIRSEPAEVLSPLLSADPRHARRATSAARQKRTAKKGTCPLPSSSVFTLLIQALPSLLFAVFGGILTGLLLQHIQDWVAFLRVPELFILLPVLMNLKGNLEMNLAARLSTSANVGDLDTPKGRRALVVGNLTLLQVQALIVSFSASLLSFTLGLLSRNNLPSLRITHAKPLVAVQPKLPSWNTPLQGGYAECLLVLAAGMLAASVNSLLLGGLVCGLVIACRILRINPDNITTPIASSLGDLMTLIFLSLTASVFIRLAQTAFSTVVFVALACSVGLHCYATLKNDYVQGFLKVGWTPLFAAMMISTCSGLLLERFIARLDGFAAISPVLTGICGNIGAISVSRISTALHANAAQCPRPHGALSVELKPDGFLKLHHEDAVADELDDMDLELKALDEDEEEEEEKEDALAVGQVVQEPVWKVSLVLMLLSSTILGGFALSHMLFINGGPGFELPFFIGFMLCVICTSAFSLLTAYHLTSFLWKFNLDPDIYAIPILSSSTDLVGQACLILAFILFKK
ncbi:hypothetical protein PCANC_23467 [Puccinia coronata f. sp. avenae]|uniref:SLC41A/MgtE integral membrane domain-containing protein n=1 Tax=Puccinia coronata f. sp. avenae TaxID=200324 RepID=A0A2N5U3I9_9BASI|nr:hypothetical protein PCANC_23467 [Puccinia coronata f. sp. avenae]PLW32258.1 hypothetical protein PCASD_17825 [Puccinia coronata f. sp. avenae]